MSTEKEWLERREMAFSFAPGQRVIYQKHIVRPKEWQGPIWFVKYTGTMDSCLVCNHETMREAGCLSEFAGTLQPYEDD